MWKLLREGVQVLKHGRKGRPKFKSLLCDVNLTKLYWRYPDCKAQADMDNLEEDFILHPCLLQQQQKQQPNSPSRSIGGNSNNSSFISNNYQQSSSNSCSNSPIRRDKDNNSNYYNSSYPYQQQHHTTASKQRRVSLTKSDADRVLYIRDILEVIYL